MRAPELFVPVVVAALERVGAVDAFARGRRAARRCCSSCVLALDLALWGQSSGWRLSSPDADGELWREPETVETHALERAGATPPLTES